MNLEQSWKQHVKKLGIELRVEDVSINPSNDVINVDTLRTI